MLPEKSKNMDSKLKLINKNILIAGGGTGGHLFPAMAIGEKLTDVRVFPKLAAVLVNSGDKVSTSVIFKLLKKKPPKFSSKKVT